MRPSSPLLDSVRDLFEGHDQMARDFAKAFVFLQKPCKDLSKTALSSNKANSLFDVSFLVGQGKAKTRLYGVRSILGVRSRHVYRVELISFLCTLLAKKTSSKVTQPLTTFFGQQSIHSACRRKHVLF